MGMPAAAPLAAGQAIWVATGSMIPPGADAVVNVERTSVEDGRVRIDGPVRAGDHIVRRGADLRRGDRVLPTGRRLRPQDLALLASVGLPGVVVARRPRVAVLITGDELRPPGSPLGPGQIYTSNGYALAAQVLEAGGEPDPPPPDPRRARSGRRGPGPGARARRGRAALRGQLGGDQGSDHPGAGGHAGGAGAGPGRRRQAGPPVDSWPRSAIGW